MLLDILRGKANAQCRENGGIVVYYYNGLESMVHG